MTPENMWEKADFRYAFVILFQSWLKCEQLEKKTFFWLVKQVWKLQQPCKPKVTFFPGVARVFFNNHSGVRMFRRRNLSTYDSYNTSSHSWWSSPDEKKGEKREEINNWCRFLSFFLRSGDVKTKGEKRKQITEGRIEEKHSKESAETETNEQTKKQRKDVGKKRETSRCCAGETWGLAETPWRCTVRLGLVRGLARAPGQTFQYGGATVTPIKASRSPSRNAKTV